MMSADFKEGAGMRKKRMARCGLVTLAAAGMLLGLGSARAEVPQAQTPLRFSADKPQLLVTAEYMTVDELTEPSLMALLRKYDILVAPCIRDYQLETEDGQKELDRLFTIYEGAGIPIVFWPLTPRPDGLYLNKLAGKTFYDYIDRIYAWADQYQHPIQAMILDIEPLNFQSGDYRSPDQPESEGLGLGPVIKAMDPKCFKQAKRDFIKIQEKLHAHGTIAISTALDYAAMDIVMHVSAWEDMSGGPTMGIDWDYVSFMNFGSNNQKFFSGLLKSWKLEDTRYLSYKLGKAIYRKYGNKGAISTGQTLPGEGHGAIYTDPAELATDISVLRAAGIMHFAIYDLQGIAQSENPEAWLQAAREAQTQPIKPAFRFKAWMIYQVFKKLTLILEVARLSVHHPCSEPIP